MIPTQYKAKLPKHLSYPIGAEAISEALEAAPHADSMSIWFSSLAIWAAPGYKRLIVEKLPYKIMMAEFQPARRRGMGPKSWIEKGWYDAKWKINVHPVLREFRQLAHNLLVEQGLPAVAEWLHSSRQAGWDSRRQRLTFIFNTAEASLSKESWTGM